MQPSTDEPSSTAPRELKAIRVAITTAVLGAGLKLVAGVATGSMSLLSSAADSLGDILVSIVNYVVVRVSDAPPDEDHNYGHTKIEGLGAMFEGGFIMAAGGFVLYESVHRLRQGAPAPDSLVGIYVMLPVLALTLGTVAYLRKVQRETGSLVLKADALHYATDIWMNLGVLASLVLVKLTGWAPLDPLISMGIGGYMLYSAWHIVQEGFHIVMDRSLDAETVARLQEMLRQTPGILAFHDFKTRGGKIPHVDFHAEVRPDMTVQEAHDLFQHVQARAKEIAGAPTRVLMHADPYGE
jgi:cation diffusion facilitator family transporter